MESVHTMSPQEDPNVAALRLLPQLPPEASHAAAVHLRARAVLGNGADALTPVGWAWSRVVLPTLLTGTVGSYLTWAVLSASSLYR